MQGSYYLQIKSSYGTGDPLRVGAHSLPGRRRDYDAEKIWQREAAARWQGALQGWDVDPPNYGLDFVLTPPNYSAWRDDVAARAELMAILEDVVGEEGLPLDALETVDWIVRPVSSKLSHPRNETEYIERHLRLSEARNPHLEPYFEGRYPVRCGDYLREFYAELDVFEAKIVRTLINRCSRKRPYPIGINIAGYISKQTTVDATHRLAAKGWLALKGMQYETIPSAVRAGKSMVLSERVLLAD